MVNAITVFARAFSRHGGQTPPRRALGLVAGVAILAFAAMILPSDWSRAADESGEFRAFGAGLLSCQRWLDDRRERNPSADQSEMWVAGYLTAYNEFVHRNRDIIHPYDGAYVLKWLDDYCRKRPENELVVAARELLIVLRRRQ